MITVSDRLSSYTSAPKRRAIGVASSSSSPRPGFSGTPVCHRRRDLRHEGRGARATHLVARLGLCLYWRGQRRDERALIWVTPATSTDGSRTTSSASAVPHSEGKTTCPKTKCPRSSSRPTSSCCAPAPVTLGERVVAADLRGDHYVTQLRLLYRIDVEHDSQRASEMRNVDRTDSETRAAIQAAMDRLASRQGFAIFSRGAQPCRA